MKLVELTLRNIGPYVEAKFAPEQPIVLVYADNAVGKTTLADSVEMVLTGKAGDPRELLRVGTAEGEIASRWETSAGEIKLARKISLRAGGKAVGSLGPAARLSEQAAWAFCHAERLLAEDVDRQKEALLAAVSPTLPVAAVAEVVPLDEAMPAIGCAWPLAEGAVLNRADVQALYDYCYKARTEVNAELKATVVPAAVDWGPSGRPDLAAMAATFEALVVEERALSVKVGETIGRQRVLAEQLRKATQRGAEAEKRAAKFRAAEDHARAVSAGQAEAERAEQTLRAWSERQASRLKAREAAVAVRNRLEGAYRDLAGLGTSCVIHESIACPLTKENRTGALIKLTAQIEDVDVPAEEAEPTPSPAPRDLRQRLADLEKEQGAALAAQEALAAAHAEVDELIAEGAKVSQMLGEPEPSSPEEQRLEELRSRITRGQQRVRRAEELLGQEAARARALEAREGGERRRATLEAAVRYLGPKGALDEALGRAVEAVLADANRFLEPWGLHVVAEADPFRLRLADGRRRLAASERWRIGAAVALAAASACGWRTVIMDGADALTAPHRAVLTRMVTEAARRGLRVILLASMAAEDVRALGARPMPAGIEVWAIDRGADRSQLVRRWPRGVEV